MKNPLLGSILFLRDGGNSFYRIPSYKKWKEALDLIIAFHYIDNFKKLFIL